jgi:hypothetical protein
MLCRSLGLSSPLPFDLYCNAFLLCSLQFHALNLELQLFPRALCALADLFMFFESLFQRL